MPSNAQPSTPPQHSAPTEKSTINAKHDATSSNAMDSLDKRILDTIQTGFPIASRPYAILAKELGVEESLVLERIRALKKSNVIRRLGANFDSWKLGFRSTLCAVKVPDDKLESFVGEVNKHVGVTHNYLRKHEYNVWFTCIQPSWSQVCNLLDSITEKTGIPILNLPAAKLYKIKVDFRMD